MTPPLFKLTKPTACCVAVLGFLLLGCRSNAAAGNADPSNPSDPSAEPAQASHASASSGGAHRVPISDPQRGMTAATLELPAGWKFAGQIVSAPGCHGMQDNLAFTAQAQDGVTAIIRLPGVRWAVTPANTPVAAMQIKKCPLVNASTAADFLKNLAVPNMHPGATIEAQLPLLPEGQAALSKQLAQLQQQYAHIPAAFGPRDATLEGARIRIAYVRNGQPVEEMLTAVISCNTTPQMGRTCFSRGITIARAPKGKLDAVLARPETTSIGNSIQWNPQWMQRKNQEQVATNQHDLNAEKAQFQANQAANQQQFNQMMANGRAQTAARTQQFNNAMAADQARQAAIDASAHNTVNYSLDRKDYINPNTGQTITTSNNYNHQWVDSSNDKVVQTNSPTFDPNGTVDPVRESWTELVPK
jgi:hypothetical protein